MGNNNAIESEWRPQFGIFKTRKYDMIFKQVQEIPFRANNGLNYSCTYLMYPTSCSSWMKKLPSTLVEVMTQQEYEDNFYKDLLNVCNAANEKVHRRGVLLDKNPNRLYSGKCTRWLARSFGNGLRALERNMPNSIVTKGLLSGLTLLVILVDVVFVFLILGSLIWVLVDVPTGKVCAQGSPNDIAYIKQVMNENPSLDTTVIDEEIMTGLKQLSERLQQRYPQYYIYFTHELEHVPDGKTTYEVDYFLIRFEKHNAKSLQALEEQQMNGGTRQYHTIPSSDM